MWPDRDDSVYGPAAGFCDNVDEHMGSIKADREFLNPFSNQWLLKEYFELWIE
jgi:hypothetical protein